MTFLWDPLRGLVVPGEEEERPLGPAASGWTPSIDVYETAEAYVLMAELPGLTEDQVDITVRDRRLTLSGKRPTKAVRAEQYHRIERGCGCFSRTFAFPLPIDVEHIAARCASGVLTVTVPKAKRPEPRRVEIG